jgi:hypothetical protein
VSVEILPVASAHVRRVWPLVDKYVAEALVFTRGAFVPSDICDACEREGMQLWIATRGDEVLAALVTEITDYPRKRIVGVPFIGGKEMRSWFRKALHTIEAWSKEMGCVGMQGGARRGWGKLAKMEEVGVLLWKSYDDIGAPLDAAAPPSKELH